MKRRQEQLRTKWKRNPMRRQTRKPHKHRLASSRTDGGREYVINPAAPHNTTTYLIDLRGPTPNYSDDLFGSMLPTDFLQGLQLM